MNASEKIVAGIDGGGTRTRVALVAADGTVLGRGEGGSGNLHDVGERRLAEHLDTAWRAAWEKAGREPMLVEAVFCGMASVGTPADREAVRHLVLDLGFTAPDRAWVDIDLTIALAGGLAGAPGIALIVGTGSSCYGRTAAGRTHQSGGWGSLLDDVGSATWLGTRAMTAAVRDHDGRGPETVLRQRVAEALGIHEMRDLLRIVDHDGLARARRAGLAPIVTEAAEEGDAVASALVAEGADALAECVEAVSRVLEWGPPPPEVVTTGGLVENSVSYREAVHRAIRRRVPGAGVQLPRIENVLGAALLAFEKLGTPLPAPARARL